MNTPMGANARIEAIRDFIRAEIMNDVTVQIEPDQDLLLTGTLDSFGVIRLVAYLEDGFDIEIPPEDVTLENFATLQLMDSYVRSRRG